MEVSWAESAIADLRAIHAYIAPDAPTYAERTVERLYGAVDLLWEFPEIGRIVPEFEDPRVRELIVGSYRLMYAYEAERVQIVTVIHASRDVLAHLDKSDFVLE